MLRSMVQWAQQKSDPNIASKRFEKVVQNVRFPYIPVEDLQNKQKLNEEEFRFLSASPQFDRLFGEALAVQLRNYRPTELPNNRGVKRRSVDIASGDLPTVDTKWLCNKLLKR